MGNTSEDEDISMNSVHSSSDLEESYEHENQKIIPKQKEIQYLRDRLMELMDTPPEQPSFNNMIIHEGKSSTRNRSKGHSKHIEFTLKQGDIRDRQGSMSKVVGLMPKMESRYKYAQKEEDLSSTNENYNKSFSLHNSD